MNATTNIESTSNPMASSLATAPSATTTPGWQTSEFWMTALGHVGLILAAASGVLPPQYAVIAAAASQVAYTLSRGMAKTGTATTAAAR